ncbi:MAG: C10 family peptidase [Prevotella sp.]|nr:C10 family peptidase [Prevotella sp.]
MMKKLFLFFALLLPSVGLQAADVSQEVAAKKAQMLLKQRIAGFNSEVLSVKTVSYEGCHAYHVVQFARGGWALISADDMSAPLIGYSDKGVFQTDCQAENFRGMMDVYSQQVVRNARIQGKSHVGWDSDALETAAEGTRASSDKISPLISVTWNQGNPYNKYCPNDASGPSGRVYVGCVAVGMAQAMSVAQWPPRPVGQYSYDHNTYGHLFINYDEEPSYNWHSILSGANGRDDVARLLWHCGVAIRMGYGPTGSGTQTSYIPNALQRNFQYPASVKYFTRANYQGDWEELILTELREGRAVAYSGHDPKKNYGHCFNLDGYDGSWFHVNWGWGGSNDGYFGLDGLRDKTMDMDYTSGQGVVVGVRAPSERPSDITLSNYTVAAGQPVGTFVADIQVESEATDPKYSYVLKGKYSPRQHKYLEAPFKVENNKLYTTEELEEGEETLTIIATNTKNQGSVERTFTITVGSTDGIISLSNDQETVVKETYFSPEGRQLSEPQKGLNILRQQMSDGSAKAIKIIKK